jgi:class 3 adenylate cyclase/tetratricopeptide (TPR) repeat protein
MKPTSRRLSAIFFADVVGFSRLMEADEDTTQKQLMDYRQIFSDLVGAFGGRVVDMAGDSILAEFSCVQSCVECAVSFQVKLGEKNAKLSAKQRMNYRVGINLGDVIGNGSNNIYGDAINTAARIQELASPGGICVSSMVRDIVEDKVSVGFKFKREQKVKNKARPVRIFSVLLAAKDTLSQDEVKVSPGLALSLKPTIAVQPFDYIGANEEHRYLSDGLAEDILTDISRFRTIQVIAKTTCFAYKEMNASPKRFFNELGAQYLLEGSLRTMGDRINITVQLVECESESQIWADRHTLNADEADLVGNSVVSRIVSMLETHMVQDRLVATHNAPTKVYKAYDYWLRGNKLLESWDRNADEESIDMFKKAIELYPEFPRPYAGLASVYSSKTILGPGNPDDVRDRQTAFKYARKGLALDPSDTRNHLNIAWIYMLARDFGNGRKHFDVAGDLNPIDSDILISRAQGMAFLGDPELALDLAREAIRLNPTHPEYYLGYLASVQFLAGEYENCIAAIGQLTQVPPETWAFLASANALAGNKKKAIKAATVFSEEIRAIWIGPSGADEADFLRWLHQIVAIKRKSDVNRLFDGLAQAGLPCLSDI